MSKPEKQPKYPVIWIVDPIGYGRHGIEGVYDSVEAAKASFPEETWVRKDDRSWVSADADACADRGYLIYEDEVQGMPSLSPTESEHQ